MAGSKATKQRQPYRRFPIAEKRRIVELTLREGASMSAVAREFGVNRHSLYQWLALYRAGKLDTHPISAAHAGTSGATFLPVAITLSTHPSRSARVLTTNAAGMNVVELTISSGAVLRIETTTLNAELIRALIAELR